MSKSPPNVLLLFTDQQRWDTLAAAGFNHMVTPNLDRLVREGCLYRKAYSPNPVCVAARHNLLTGLPARYHGYSENNSHPLDERYPTLPRILSNNGYHTQAIGKMHFQPRRRHSGFDKMELMEETFPYRDDDEYAMYLKDNGLGHIQSIHGVRSLLYMLPQRSLIPEEHHGTNWVADRSVDFIRREAGHRPFFLWSSWIAPHPPFDIPDSVADLYKDRDLPAPLTNETPISPIAALSKGYADFPEGEEKAYCRRMREAYYSSITFVDKAVGRVIDALEETGQLDNTLIIFTSDHGEMLGDHGAFQKMLPYDSSSRIPFIVRYPKHFEAGSVCDDLVGLNDILPTILDSVGAEYPGPYELPGGSLLRDDVDRTYHYMEHNSGPARWVSLRNQRFKYTYYYRGGYEELFDMVSDSGEGVNLLASDSIDPDTRATHSRLRSKLCELEEKWGLRDHTAGGDFLRLAENDLSHTNVRNKHFPNFQKRIADPEERAAMNCLDDEVFAAVANEPIVDLRKLDLETWKKNGAPGSAVERIRNSS